MRPLFYILLIVFSTQTVYGANQPKVEAQLSTTTFTINQGALLSIKVTGDRNPRVILPEIDGIDFQSRGKSSQMSYINGSMSSSLSLQYVITATQEGTYSLNGIQVEIDGKTFSPSPLSFTVHSPQTTLNEDGGKLSFIETTLKKSFYLGEKIPVTIHAFFARKQQIEIHSSPQIVSEEISMAPFSQNPQQQETQKEGVIYDTITWNTELSSVASGTFPIAFQLDASILTREPQRSSLNGFNDPFFSSMFSTTTRTPLKVTGEEQQITILPLPTTDQPVDFSGAVGKFALSVDTMTQKADIGEPVQITMTITGSGNFDLVHPPQLTENSQWKSYPAQRLEDNLTQHKSFQQVLVAKESGSLNLPQYSFSYFDPEQKRYVTLFSEEKSINIMGQKALPKVAEASTDNLTVKKVQKDVLNLVKQHAEIGRTYKEIRPLFFSTWFVVASIFFILAFLFLSTRHVINKNKEKNSGYYQKRALYKELKQEILDIEKYIAKENLPKCQDSLIRLIQKYFAFHLLKEAHSISPHSLRAVDKNDALVKVFNTLYSMSYTGNSLSPRELTEMVQVINKRLEADS